MRVPDSGSLVTTGTEQRYFYELVCFVIPTAVRGAYQLTVITPGIRKGFVIAWLFAIESEAYTVPDKMRANECLMGLSVGLALHFTRHSRTIVAGKRGDVNGFENAPSPRLSAQLCVTDW